MIRTLNPQTSPPSTAARLDGYSLVALCVAMCSQIDVRHIGRDTLAQGLGYATKTLAIALPDVVFALVFLWFVFRTIQTNSWKRLWWPPLPCFALIFVMVISALHSPTIFSSIVTGHKPITKESKEAIAEILQWTGYFVLAPWMFVNLMNDRRGVEPINRRTLGIASFAFAVILAAVLALVQGIIFKSDVPRALFGSPNMFAAFVALVVPFLVVSPWVTSGGRDWKSIGFFVLLVLLVFTIVSPFAAIALLIGLGVSMIMPGRDVRVAWVLLFATAVVVDWVVPMQPAPMKAARADFLSVASKHAEVKKQYIEWQAVMGWNSPRERAFATGFGPGNYQLNIGPLYASLPNEEKMPPDSNNLFLVQAASIGILGLGALLWVWSYFFGLAWKAAQRNPGDWIPVAVAASLSSWLFVNLFHAMIVRGAGLILAFLFALAVLAAGNARSSIESKLSE